MTSIGTALYLGVRRIESTTLVNKWIGETEKNLSQVPGAAEQGHSMLLLDNVDTFFDKRTDVKNGYDRFANIEMPYLLQRLEWTCGIVVLTSNLRSNIDDAFLRRLR
jgi:SpoVK/Ycf46/Vps4 family AAA+-type ATPase